MPILTVREDRHGAFVKTNGGIYRPQASKWSYSHKIDGVTVHKAGDKIKGRMISQSPHAKVGDEIWAYHDSYVGLKSEECWHPLV